MYDTAEERALRECPDDPEAWQRYGHRLTEVGDARGALIRLQQRLAAGPPPATRARVEREIAALEEEHAAGRDSAVPEGVTVSSRQHGFATGLTLHWSERAPERLAEALSSHPLVTAVRLSGAADGPDGMEDDGDEDEDDWYDDLDENGEPIPLPLIEAREADALARLDLTAVTSLSCAYLRIGDAGAKALTTCTFPDVITALDLRYTALGDEGLIALAESGRFGSVTRLHLQGNALTAPGVAALASFTRLTELDLRYNAIGEQGAEALLAAPFAGSLRRLSLHRPDVSQAGARRLAHATELPLALRILWRTV
ncbi:hypothetical protein [Streptomyces sedi]|uniref:Leucine-rich repeat domain-containing protein n=1 Tax=Streptomyces sedi TaxID=555059 RepID=A0A5C4VDF2_9ACTN|nr:hypothetical protein [Streptomyces sedi]TNM33575.1 hypothetical protein FH715_04285 [Streptomyces sedi]